MAAGGIDTDEGATRGTKSGTWLIIGAAAEKSASGAFPAIDALLPMIGNGQSASLRAAECVPIIPELLCKLRRRGEGLRETPWTSLKR